MHRSCIWDACKEAAHGMQAEKLHMGCMQRSCTLDACREAAHWMHAEKLHIGCMQRSCRWEASECMQMTAGVGLQAFQTAEELEAEDSWFCSKCKRHVQANKKLDLWAVPEVLVVHLKRFFFTRTRRDKLDVQVDFPLENWDLSDYLPHHQVRLSCCCCCCVTIVAGL